MQSSSVDLPEPEGPKRTVMPGAKSWETWRSKGGEPGEWNCLRICTESMGGIISQATGTRRGG